MCDDKGKDVDELSTAGGEKLTCVKTVESIEWKKTCSEQVLAAHQPAINTTSAQKWQEVKPSLLP